MRRLAEQVRQIEETNRKIARLGCLVADRLLEDLTPQLLEEEQLHRRQSLLWVESRLRELEARRSARRHSIKARIRRSPELGRIWNEHRRLLQDREGALKGRRAILRQLGDAIAWIVLRGDPHLIAALFVRRTHYLPSHIGLVGPITLISAAHASGRFLVIDNDLTRCLGIGDLTVVRADGRWVRPLSIEIKSSGQFQVGAEVELDLFTAVSDHPADVELFSEFQSILTLRDPVKGSRPSRASEPQSEELLVHSKFLAELTRRVRARPSPESSLWDGMSSVLSKALTLGSCLGFLDDGIVAVAVRLGPGDDSESELRRILGELNDLGFGGGRPGQISATIDDLKGQDILSAYVPPIALWRVPLALRSALLSGELFYGCVYDSAVWERAMASEGVILKREGMSEVEHWTLRKGTQIGRFDPIEVRKAVWGVLFGGVRPREIAAMVSQTLSALDAQAQQNA